MPEGAEINHLIKLNQLNGTPQNHHTTCYTHYKLSQFTETLTKQTMIAAEEDLLAQILALLPPFLILRRTPKGFDTTV